MFCCIHGKNLLTECAERFSPEVETVDACTLLFDVSRLNRLYGSAYDIAQAITQYAGSLGMSANVAIAPNPETAILTARNFPGATVIPEENAADQLAHLDIENLPLGPEMRQTLASWGIGTFAELAELPENGIAERLGPDGIYLQKLAKGAVQRPLRIGKPDIIFGERVELEHSLSLLEPLLFILARILNNQCGLLQSHGMAAHRVSLTLELEDRTEHQRFLRLPLPMRQSKALLKLLQLDLEAHPPQAATVAIRLDLQPVLPRTVQNGLFLPVTPAPDKLEVTLARIRALVGSENAGVAELINTHHPNPFRLVAKQPAADAAAKASSRADRAAQLAFRYFHPPLPANVEIERRRPLRVAAPGVRGNIVTYAGPWRTSGDWWTGDSWDREEWDISLNDGGIYRMYREPGDRWFLEGVYD
ncbi:MAG: DNA polymerase Y family protein [Bryobacteraceae bacterium]